MFSSTIQVSVFVFVTALIGFLTYLSCRGQIVVRKTKIEITFLLVVALLGTS